MVWRIILPAIYLLTYESVRKKKKKKECVNKGPETMLNISKLCKESLKKHSWEVSSTKQIASSVLCIL